MNRRDFAIALGMASAAKSSLFAAPGDNAAPDDYVEDQAHRLSLANGSSRLDLVPGPTGYGIELLTRQDGRFSRLAHAPAPVRVFYGDRTSRTLTDVAFTSAHGIGRRLNAKATFTDRESNRWSVTFTASPCLDTGFECVFDYKLLRGVVSNVFFEHSLIPDLPASTEEVYVLMPGLLYDGNRLTRAPMAIPQLAAAQNFQVDTPILTLAIPVAAFHEKRTGQTLMVLTAPTTELDMSGFTCVSREDDHRISVMAPCYRENHFHHNHYTTEAPHGATVLEGARFSVPVSLFALSCPNVLALFEALQPMRTLARPVFQRTNKLPLSAAASLVEDNFNTRMWADGPGNQFYINAMKPDYDIAQSGVAGLVPGWQLQVGWCAGPITGYALLKMGNARSLRRARAMMDKIATGICPSGLFWSIYANGAWDPAANRNPSWQHIRMPADATFYMLKSIALERSRGLDHSDWEKAAVSNLDAFMQLWTDHQDFGHRVDRNTLAIIDPGTAAGALCIASLALGASLPRGKQYLSIARDASKEFYERFVQTGWIVAGPLDIPNAPDSESVIALLESYVTMFEVTKDPLYLNYATDTMRHLSTWIVAYNATFPRGTFCRKRGIQTVGGVLANSQNHHIGPSFCTNSGSALLRLYRHTGDTLPLRLLEDVISGLPQYVSTGIDAFNMAPGMVSEQFNMSDELGTRGDMGWVSASWPETCVLLSYGEVPSIFVDLESNTLAVFDQVAVAADWTTRTLHLSNPTNHRASIRLEKSTGQPLQFDLEPLAQKTISL